MGSLRASRGSLKSLGPAATLGWARDEVAGVSRTDSLRRYNGGVSHGEASTEGGRPAGAVGTCRPETRRADRAAWVLIVLAIGHVVATRMCWSDIPLQTDTGIWAYFGSRLLDGALPYRDLWDNKPPGIAYTFAAVEWLFGVGHDRALLWLDAVVTVVVGWLTYVVARRFASRAASAAGVLLFSLVFCHRVLADWGNNAEKFVALFEMAACLLALGLIGQSGRYRRWMAVGLCCGLAGMFKQTGFMFLLSATLVCAWTALRGRWRGRSAMAAIGCAWLGAAVPWLIVCSWMAGVGILDEFVWQVVQYDISRVGSGQSEGSRLLDVGHWRQIGDTLQLGSILFAPAVLAVAAAVVRSVRCRTVGEGPNELPPHGLSLVATYACLMLLLFQFAPYGHGHYLLQAAAPAAVIVAWWFDVTFQRRAHGFYRAITVILLLVGLGALRDHLDFTLNPTSKVRDVYAQLAQASAERIDVVRHRTTADQSVMLWPTDYAANYYACRRTPLEVGRSHDLFGHSVGRLDPPMPELLRRIQADPPDVVADWTALEVVRDGSAASPSGPLLRVQAGTSLLSEPSDDSDMKVERLLAPLKRWLRANYGGQIRDDRFTLYFRGKPWRPWETYLRGVPSR